MSWLMGDRGGRNCRWVLAALGKTDFGVCGVVGGMMVIERMMGNARRRIVGWVLGVPADGKYERREKWRM